MMNRKSNIKFNNFITTDMYLTYNGKQVKTLDNYSFSIIPRAGDILQWNGVRYPIKEVIFHQKEGFVPYIEFSIDEDKFNEDELLL